ncbi:MAG: gliding motility-associated C-terminal domain-containing protein [Saprospiraceae bacterium]|nr:gliding motility-associated C-terminal domain-containing protein [Saprospiraceae bacterium]
MDNRISNRIFPLLIILYLIFNTFQISAQQTFIIYNENFSTGGSSITLNTSGVGTPSGTNQWIVNSQYLGNSTYPNTTSQNFTYSGTISNPDDKYMHIYNTSAAVANCNYNPSVASDRFATTGDFCTMGVTNVTFSFFYICEGSANAYGRIYYSLDAGSSWNQASSNIYNGKSMWKYEAIINPAFNNQASIRFGFRWFNNGTSPTNIALGIDDIFLIGTYDSLTNPVNINITNIPDSVCQGTNLVFSYTLSDTLCDGQYSIELSDSLGNFALLSWTFNKYSQSTSGTLAINIPTNIPAASCYKIRVSRVSPPPVITGIVSACFAVVACPNTITTLQPVVTMGGDSVCIGSSIDIPFWSTGTFGNFNMYTAQLSDTAGSFANPLWIGALQSTSTFDPTVVPSPGTVSGMIPNTPEGCGYYLRITASVPGTIGTVWGPFCIKKCPITTNNYQNINFCINNYVGDSTMMPVDVDTSFATVFDSTNLFQVQLLDKQSFAHVNTGSLGSIQADTSVLMKVKSPPLPGLISMGLAPDMYYMRVVATSANDTNDLLGKVVKLIIGAPDDIAPVIHASDTLICQGDVVQLWVTQHYMSSKYQWYLNGSPFPPNSPKNPLWVLFNGAAGQYVFSVQETHNGCPGPVSSSFVIDMIVPPSASIAGKIKVCVGDTTTYTNSFINNTFYSWSASCGTIIDTANNQIRVVWDTVGTCKINVSAINMCGSNNGVKTVYIYPSPTIFAGSDTTICLGDTITLSASGGVNYSWTPTSSLINPNSSSPSAFPNTTTNYLVTGMSSQGCKNYDSTIVNVMPAPIIDIGDDTLICEGDVLVLDPGAGYTTYLWNDSTTNQTLSIDSSGTYWVEVTIPNGCVGIDDIIIDYQPGPHIDIFTEECINENHPVVLDAGSFLSYLWQDGSSSQYLTAYQPGIYWVKAGNGNCISLDSIELFTCLEITVPNVFTPNGDGYNDVFTIDGDNITKIEMQIFNRWGQIVFTSNDVELGWDGKTGGVECPEGVYYWIINYEGLGNTVEEKTGSLHGTVTMFRK